MFLIVISSMTAVVTYAQDNGRISGTVLDKRTQKPISGAAVSIKGSNKAALTDTNGLFRITGIPVKTHTIEARATGYQLLSLYNIILSAGNEYTVTIELEPQVTELAAVVVSNNRRTAKAATLESPLSVQRLTLEEIRSNPGGNFDISKAIQALPGVGGGAEGGSFRNDIIIRGGAPNENVYYLDGIEIPVLNHFQTQGSSGGPQGMLNISFIEDVKLSSSAFDARYDNALSSVFQFKQRNGNANKFQGNARISATDLSATLEGPMSKDRKTTFLASAPLLSAVVVLCHRSSHTSQLLGFPDQDHPSDQPQDQFILHGIGGDRPVQPGAGKKSHSGKIIHHQRQSIHQPMELHVRTEPEETHPERVCELGPQPQCF